MSLLNNHIKELNAIFAKMPIVYVLDSLARVLTEFAKDPSEFNRGMLIQHCVGTAMRLSDTANTPDKLEQAVAIDLMEKIDKLDSDIANELKDIFPKPDKP